MRRRRLTMIAVICLVAGLTSLFGYRYISADRTTDRVAYMPAETDQVLANPYMGFVVDAKYDDAKQPFRLAHANLTWRELEPDKGKYAFDAIEKKFNFRLWKERGVKLVMRVVLDYPRDTSHMDIPDWLYEEIGKSGEWYDTDYGKGFSPDYTSPVLIENHERLIRALSERYNNDPLIAFVQLGSIGHWGEWHTRNDDELRIPFPKEPISDQYAGHYVRYFTNKHLMMRRPHEIALKNGMGLFNDAFGKRESTVDGFLRWYTEGYTSWLTGEKEPAMPDFWTKAPSGGEFASEKKYMGDSSMEETLRQARLTHVSMMGPNAPAREKPGGPLQSNIDRFLKTIGYRFVIAKASHEKEAKTGDRLNVTISLVNRGVAPFYFSWPFELSLADSNGEIVAKATSKADIRQWLPGERQVSDKLPIPSGLKPGEYTVHAAILDPETGKPGIDFAIDGRRADGRYALGTVTVIPGK
ncbi:DUF4832 domain-containing protein [Paenibacillus sp. MZ04-78.2]|uniref:DUF4832 domain-containing protein n=1 Tax=Paenibacillus sp. MZ04-78.2 TaxID=2962034 RepID=UPI0020B68AC8|nr:DUF4832 domain-containing protein [Paenibacillus sp. MZ04-78.2]MCP3774146.1 DUF4832 domain-containing protein [Paenibacillus sp. MZ04-78.2]